MRKGIRLWVVFALLWVALPAWGDSGLRMFVAGQVIDKATGKGIPDVYFYITGPGYSYDTRTNKNGRFLIKGVRSGVYRVYFDSFYEHTWGLVDLHGYVPVKVEPERIIVKEGMNVVGVKIWMEKGAVLEGRFSDCEGDGLHPEVRDWGPEYWDIKRGLEPVQVECETERFGHMEFLGELVKEGGRIVGYRVEGLPWEAACKGRFRFPGYPSYGMSFRIEEGRKVLRKDINLSAGNATVFGRILDAKDGTVVAGWVDILKLNKDVTIEDLGRNWDKKSFRIGPSIILFSNFNFLSHLNSVKIFNEGKYFFKCIPPGKYGFRIGALSGHYGEFYAIIKIYPGKNEINFLLDFTKVKNWKPGLGPIVKARVVRGKVKWKMPSRRKRKKKRTSAEGGEM